MMPKVILIRGPLGVGKSTVSKTLAQDLSAEYISVDHMLEDNHLVGQNGIPLESFLKVNSIIFKRAQESRKTLVVDGNFYYQEQIDDLKNKFKDAVRIFTLTADVETCMQRDSKREKVYGEDAVRHVYMLTTKVKAGCTIDTTDLQEKKTIQKIKEKI